MLDFWNEYNVYIIVVAGILFATLINISISSKFDIYKIQRDRYRKEFEYQLDALEKSWNTITIENSRKNLEKREEQIYRKYNSLISNLDGAHDSHTLKEINEKLNGISYLLLVFAILYFILD